MEGMDKPKLLLKPISQEHPMGCAVACVASLNQMKYQEALELFEEKENAWTRGFYCSEIVKALKALGRSYSYEEYSPLKHTFVLRKAGTIAFVMPCSKYPSGHFLVRSSNGWMNPWTNFPLMKPVKAAIEKRLPGKVSWIIYEMDEWQL